MTIERDGDRYHLTCDVCGEATGEKFYDFYDAVNFKKREGWKSQKHRGEWEDVCPECQEAGE